MMRRRHVEHEASLFTNDGNGSRRNARQQLAFHTIDELFADIPEKVRFKGEYNIKQAKSESALTKELHNLLLKMQMHEHMHLS